MSLSEGAMQKLRYSIHANSPSPDVSFVRVDKSGDYTRYVTNDMAIAQEAYVDRDATVQYDSRNGEYTVEFKDVKQVPIVPYMPLELQDVEKTLPAGCTLEYQFADGMWHVVQTDAWGRNSSSVKSGIGNHVYIDDNGTVCEKGKDGVMDKTTVEKRAHDFTERYATRDMRSGDGYLVTIDDAGKVLGMPCHEFTLDAPVVLPEGQQMPLQNLRYDWYPNVPEASESDLRASQGHRGYDTGHHFLEPSLHAGEQEFIRVFDDAANTDLTFHIYQSGGTIANEMMAQPISFADALIRLQAEAGESVQGLERMHNDILGLARDTDGDTSCALVDAIDDMYDDPDDSGNRVAFYRILAAYMLDNNLDLSGLQTSLVYETQDRMKIEERLKQEPETEQKSAVQDYYDKVWE